MFTATLDRHTTQRAVCLFFSFVIVSVSLTLGAIGIESMARSAPYQNTTLVAQA